MRCMVAVVVIWSAVSYWLDWESSQADVRGVGGWVLGWIEVGGGCRLSFRDPETF